MTVEILDVVIVGAGLSGVGVACHLLAAEPTRSVALLEARDATGGTWDLFRYPGVRSDSDLATYGFAFRPWTEQRSIADGASILAYLRDTAAEHGVTDRVRLQHRVVAADWDSATSHWTLQVEQGRQGTLTTLRCRWLVAAAGYFRYDRGHRPDLPGEAAFEGMFVHPQHWPDDLDLAGRRVVVLGSGATAVTIVPALAGTAAHVTMLQRTPSYVLPLPAVDTFANRARDWLGDERGHALARRRNSALTRQLYAACRRWPRLMRRFIRWVNRRHLPDHIDVDTHFAPPYDPWRQRLCFVPDGDLFDVLSNGTASIVTDEVAAFTPDGITLASGEHLPADVVVTATGLELQALGGMTVCVDGETVEAADTTAFRSMMLSGVPNLAFVFGYTNASWTPKVDLVGEHLARLLTHLDAHGLTTATPSSPGDDVELAPLLDLASGYVRRGEQRLPRRGDRGPWQVVMDVRHDHEVLLDEPVTHDELVLR